MRPQMLRLTIVLFASIAITNAATTKWKCVPEEESKITEYVWRVMGYGRSDMKYPETKTELKNFCKTLNSLVNQIEDYKNVCLFKQTKQVVSVVLYSIRGSLGSYCKNVNAKKAKELLTATPCANAASKGYYQCDRELTDLLLAVADNKDSKQQLGQMCCGYINTFKCLRSKTAPFASKQCTPKAVDINETYLRGFFDNAVNVICGDFNEHTDKCDNFKFEHLSKKAAGQLERPVSFYAPLVKILSRL